MQLMRVCQPAIKAAWRRHSDDNEHYNSLSSERGRRKKTRHIISAFEEDDN